ncbi:hypothetical protein VPHD148_0279 [Vibrio phage D148]
MSEISDLLWLKAQELGAEASAKQNEWQMVKSAAVTALEARGVSSSDAQGLLDNLAERANPTLEADIEKAAQLSQISSILEKAAQYVTELEVKLDSKEAEIEGMHKAASDAVKAPSVEALTGTGAFSSEDLEALNSLDDATLSKVASLTDNQPWNLGGPSERQTVGFDALTEFLTS